MPPERGPSAGSVEVNDALLPGLVAAGGGSALAAGIYVREARAEAAMRASRVRLALTFPTGVGVLQARAALSGMAGLSPRVEWVFEVAASEGGIHHYLLVPAEVRHTVVSMLTGALPGLRVVGSPAPRGRATLAGAVWLPTPLVLTTEQPEAASRTLLAGIAGLAPGEQAILRVALRPGSPRPRRVNEPADRSAREIELAWRRKLASGPGFQASGLVLIRAASTARARELREHLTSSLRSRRGPVGALRITTERGNRSLASLPRVTRSAGWLTASEALGVLGWPLGDQAVPGVEVGTRQLPVPRYVPREGRPLLIGSDSGANPRPVALTPEAARLHLGLFGRTGSGKTTVLLRLILAALAEGIGGVFIDPKDAIPTLLDHIPAEFADRIVVLDLASAGPLPGLDLFGSGDPVMRSDVILSVVKGLSDGWGPRIERYLRLGLRSLSAIPDPVLFDWLRVFTDPAFRRSVVARISDPIMAAEWRAFEEGLSPAEQFAHVSPAIARVTDLLSRPVLRAVLSQPQPKLNIERVLAEGRWLCVSVSPGTLGEPAARLLGGVVSYLTWAAVEKRAAIPESQRRQVMFVLDEIQSLAHLPVGLEVFFERTRSLNCAVVAATQAAVRLPESTRQSLLANVGSLLVLRSGADEAQRLARELAPLSPSDLIGLGRYEIAGRVNTGGAGRGSAVITGHTEPLSPATGMGSRIHQLSAQSYGRDPREVEEQLRRRASRERPEGSEYGRTGRAA
jgi:Type IV secretion-system coupling protein DNA-binding domain